MLDKIGRVNKLFMSRLSDKYDYVAPQRAKDSMRSGTQIEALMNSIKSSQQKFSHAQFSQVESQELIQQESSEETEPSIKGATQITDHL